MKKGSLSTIFLMLILLVGLSLLLYPTVSDYWNNLHQSKAVVQYAEEVANLDNEVYEQLLAAARQYNDSLYIKENRYRITEEEKALYESLLNISGNGVMGYIDIPSIDVTLPIYHGTKESVLQIAVGHVEWSSLPVGGSGTHSVISGHRGLPSAKLFTNLDKLVVGDTFVIRVLDETMTYSVDQILIVLPDELDALEIVPGRDLCTLVTCTPYGVNSHRILVRGHRVENEETADTIRVTADAIQVEPVIMAPLVAAPMLLILLIWLLIPSRKKRD